MSLSGGSEVFQNVLKMSRKVCCGLKGAAQNLKPQDDQLRSQDLQSLISPLYHKSVAAAAAFKVDVCC